MKKYRVIIDLWDEEKKIEETFYNKTGAMNFYNSYTKYLSKMMLHFNGTIWTIIKYEVW